MKMCAMGAIAMDCYRIAIIQNMYVYSFEATILFMEVYQERLSLWDMVGMSVNLHECACSPIPCQAASLVM